MNYQQSVSIVGLEIQPGLEQTVEQNRNSPFAGIQVAIGNFENALQLLKKQIGLVNPKPYKNIFTDAFMTASLQISSVPFTKAFDLRLPLLQLQSTPALLENELKQAYKLVSDYKLQEATEKFNQILLLIPLQVLNTQGEVQNSIKLIRICLEYIVALKCEILKSNYANDQVRCLELSAYMSMCQVQPIHRILFLKNVMGQAYKLKDYIYASYFAKKIVQLGELHPQAAKEETTSKAKKVYQACEQQGTNQHKINFDEKLLSDTDAVLKLCSKTLEIIKNRDVKKCPYCSATYNQQFDGITCQICQISKVGVEVMGLKIQNQ